MDISKEYHVTCYDSDERIIIDNYKKKYGVNMISRQINYFIFGETDDFIQLLMSNFNDKNSYFTYETHDQIFIYFGKESHIGLVSISMANSRRDDNKNVTDTIKTLVITYMGGKQFITEIDKLLIEHRRKNNYIQWFYNGFHERHSKKLPITDDIQIYDEYYPQITNKMNLPSNNVDTYFNNYLNSNNSIMLLMGVPGSGKTNLIKYFLKKCGLNAMLSYDPDILQSDSFFVDFFFNDDINVLVLEDCDQLIGSRKENNNIFINKILNSSDGLIKMTNKKIIITTNLSNIDSIDPALYRAGRCFDIVNFKHYSHDEATAVANKLGININQNEYTLSDLFSIKNGTFDNKQEKKKIGFV